MKLFVSAVLVSVFLASALFAEDKIYPLDIKMHVYPEEIRYGDACFLVFSVTNKGQETLYLPCGDSFLDVRGMLCHEGEKVLPIGVDVVGMRRSATIHFDGLPVKPRETLKYHIRVAWCPPFDSISSEQSTKLLQLVNDGKKDYQIQFASSYLWAYRSTTQFRLYSSRLGIPLIRFYRGGIFV